MNTALLLSYVLTVSLLIATPGPVVALVVNTASRSGPKRAMATALGSNWGSLVLIGVAAWLIIASAALDTRLLSLLSLLGCVVIGYLAVGSLREAMVCETATQPISPATQGGLLQGFVVGICNPKDIIFFVSFFPQFLQVSHSLKTSLAVLSLLWVLIDLLILGAWIMIAGRLSKAGNSRLISLCSGVALLLIALLGLAYNLRALWA
ncbi:LysE family translocator [Pseudomonas sp. LJDD11]|uniref:LysE family translocator n=1 Tax=Pseudomonas sp. LJDD11 TaxID=2931984 RepID=UPI00211C8E0E|nr:LysE family translocator [Pseudomonas sp. LJDD11]